jgi:5-methyltetrahydropteroyltriglutamate--homocysteine methyltransferase
VSLPPIAATTVGSFPRPAWLANRTTGSVQFAPEGDALDEAKDDATVISILDQESAGLDLLTDGEQRRTSFINHILAGWDGIDLSKLSPKAIRRRDNPRPVPTVVGQVRRRVPAAVDDMIFAKAHTGKPVKASVPGPMTVIDTTFDEVYGDETRLAMDVAEALNGELRDLQAAGADYLQIDEPAMTRYHEKVQGYGASALDRCLEGITVPTFVHLCYGYPGTGIQQHHFEYPELIEMLMETRIGGFSMEFARSGYGTEILAGVGDRLVMFGCVDPSDSPIEPTEAVAKRVRSALRYVEPERLFLAPDCGLMTISRELAHAKAAQLVETAQTIRGSL